MTLRVVQCRVDFVQPERDKIHKQVYPRVGKLILLFCSACLAIYAFVRNTNSGCRLFVILDLDSLLRGIFKANILLMGTLAGCICEFIFY